MKYISNNPQKYKILKDFVKSNRQELTYPEKIIWNLLRRNNLGFKFRRQHAIADYIVDFISLELKLVIEIDGESHNYSKEYDDLRTEILNSTGYKVIRFTNDEVVAQGNFVESQIRSQVEECKTSLRLSPKGESEKKKR